MTEAPLVEKLVGCRAKLDRAARQIAALDHAGRSWGRRRPFDVERHAPEPGELRFVVAGLRPPPPALAVHAGEIVHDLHSALDHLVWAVAERPWRRTQFPIFLEQETWAGNSEANVRSIAPAYVAVVEDAQPFHARQPA